MRRMCLWDPPLQDFGQDFGLNGGMDRSLGIQYMKRFGIGSGKPIAEKSEFS